tara:strand:- start:77 stop:802 length:726 start_codon:yes stop_codon:yes gene_type:complete
VKKKNKNTLLQLICVILLVIFTYKAEVFQNLLFIKNNDYEQRFSKVYDFCNYESVGYLQYLKKKYKFKKRPKIINYIHTPSLNWVTINPRTINDYSEYKILLNYPGEKIDLKFNSIGNNVYQIFRLNFYKDKTDSINKLELSFKNDFQSNNNLKIDLYADSIIKSKKIKSFYDYSIKKNNIIEYKLDIDIKKTEYENESLIFKIKNLGPNIIDEAKFISINKYKINEYSMLDNYKNCYLIK